MATHEQIYNALARHELAEQVAKGLILSAEEIERLDKHGDLYRKGSDALVGLYGGAEFIPSGAEDKLSEALFRLDPGLEGIVHKLIVTTTKILEAGNG